MPLEHAGVEVGQAGERDLGVATERGHRHQSPKAQGRLGRHLVDQIVEAGGCHTTPAGLSVEADLDEDLEGVDAINPRQRTDQFGPVSYTHLTLPTKRIV